MLSSSWDFEKWPGGRVSRKERRWCPYTTVAVSTLLCRTDDHESSRVTFERNFGRSLMAAYTDHYMSDFILHGTSDANFHSRLHNDLMHSVQVGVQQLPGDLKLFLEWSWSGVFLQIFAVEAFLFSLCKANCANKFSRQVYISGFRCRWEDRRSSLHHNWHWQVVRICRAYPLLIALQNMTASKQRSVVTGCCTWIFQECSSSQLSAQYTWSYSQTRGDGVTVHPQHCRFTATSQQTENVPRIGKILPFLVASLLFCHFHWISNETISKEKSNGRLSYFQRSFVGFCFQCLMHLEDKLQEIYFKSITLGEYMCQHKKIDSKELSFMLG